MYSKAVASWPKEFTGSAVAKEGTPAHVEVLDGAPLIVSSDFEAVDGFVFAEDAVVLDLIELQTRLAYVDSVREIGERIEALIHKYRYWK